MSLSKNQIIQQLVGEYKENGINENMAQYLDLLAVKIEDEANKDILLGVVGLNKKLIGQNDTPVIELMFTFVNGESTGQLKTDNLFLSEKSAWKIMAVLKGCGVPKSQRDTFDWEKFNTKSDEEQVLYLESMLLGKKFKPVMETREYNGKEYENIKYYNYSSQDLSDSESEALEKTIGNYERIIAGSIDKGAKYTTANRGSNNDSTFTESDDLPF